MSKQATQQATEVVVIGAGYAGLLATVRLAGKLRGQPARLTLVNASDVFTERLRLHEFAANKPLARRPIADTLRGTGVNFVQGTVRHLDPARRVLTVESATETRQMRYDYLLYALGSTIDRDSVPGVREYAYVLTPNGPLSAQALRARLPGVAQARGRMVVVGAGATGVEAAAEFATDYPDLRVHLITRGPFAQFLGGEPADIMHRALERVGVTIQEETTVQAVEADAVQTSAGPVPYDLCLWAGGFVAAPLAREAGLAVNERGQILVDPYMRAASHAGIYAVGDAAYPIEDPSVHVRMSAFTAIILGAHGADCLAATLRGQAPKPLSFAYMGQGIALGAHNAIGFGKTPDDRPKAPYFTGRVGYTIRESAVRLLANLPNLERRWPGFFTWAGKGRYAAMKRQQGAVAQVDSRP